MILQNRHSFFVMLFLLPALLLGAQSKSSSSGSSTTNNQNQAKPAPAAPKKTPAAPKASKKAPAKQPVRRAPAVPVGQARPTKDRYAEIQKALAAAGYYSGKATGVWGDESVKALQSFQQDQGLEPTGKIDAMTLIHLDLGPKYEVPENAAAAETNSPG